MIFTLFFTGLTIETVSSTNLIISIGLCVDCPAHITHEYLMSKGLSFQLYNFRFSDNTLLFLGTRLERARKSLRYMGPAVLKGGFSTFLSFILLANSNSHVFETFFKVSLIKVPSGGHSITMGTRREGGRARGSRNKG